VAGYSCSGVAPGGMCACSGLGPVLPKPSFWWVPVRVPRRGGMFFDR